MVLQLIPGGTAAHIVTCDFNENPKSDFDFDLGFVNKRDTTFRKYF